MRRFFVLCFLALVISLIAQVTIPREEAVYAPFTGVASTWNLYSPAGGTAGAWGIHFIFAAPFYYDAGKDVWLPFLADKYEFLDDKTIRVHIRQQARWSDGVPITADDFVYTFELTKELATGPGVGWHIYIEYVKAVNEKTVEFRAKEHPLNYYQLLSFALRTQPVPKHVYEALKKQGVNLREWANAEPERQVVSGPYKLHHQDPTIVVYQRIDDWWGKDIFGLPRPKYLAFVFYKDNPSSTLALEQGNADWAHLFIPSVWEFWEKKKLPVGTWFKKEPYYLPQGLSLIYINNTKPGLKDALVRKAIAYAIPYEEMVKKAYFSYGIQAHPSMVIDVYESNKQYVNYDLAKRTWGTTDGRIPFNMETANRILDEGGYKKGSDGIRVAPDGTKLAPYTIAVPYGWTDWMMMCEIIAKNLRSIGIDVRTEFPDFAVWWDRLIKGAFDLVIGWSASAGFDHPFNVYRFVLDHRLTGPIGEPFPAGNWERYQNQEVVRLLDEAVSTLDSEKRRQAYFKIQEIIYKDVPSVPAFCTALWYEYSEKYWANWPNEERPYWATPDLINPEGLPVLFGISLKNAPQPVPSWFDIRGKGGYLIPTLEIFDALQKAAK